MDNNKSYVSYADFGAKGDGVSDDFFNQQKEFLEKQKQLAKETALNNQPGLSNGNPPSSQNANDDLDKKLRQWAGLK